MGGRGSGGSNKKSDAEKLQHSKHLDNRWSEQARAEKKIVNLFAHPRLDTVPEAEFPLGDQGKKKYRELAEMLLKSGQLTIITKGYAESAAVAFEQIFDLRSNGKEVRASLIQQFNRALSSCQQFDIDKAVNTPEGQRQNRFARAGFASRSGKDADT